MRSRWSGAAILIAAVAGSAALCFAGDADDVEALPVPAVAPSSALLDSGFHQLYELNFPEARRNFRSYQNFQPQDPLGKAAEAASLLYEEFNAKGILSSEFFVNDSKFLHGADGSATQNRNPAFLSANTSAREMAAQQLKSRPNDARALLVITMTDGMEADYDALIIRKQLAGLNLTRQAEGEAMKLLAVDPSAEDAYLALGAGNYVIGCLPGYKRAFLWFGGIHGDRAHGIEQMQRAASRGHYLRPFAKILLALAYERERQPDRARALLTDLVSEFPHNPLYAHELALLDHSSAPCRVTSPC